MRLLHRLKVIFIHERRFALAVPALLWVTVLLLLPLVCMIYKSFSYDSSLGISLHNYVQIFDIVHITVIFRSLMLASGAAVCTLMLGFPVAYFVAIEAKHMRSVLLFLLTLPFWTNFITQVYAWFFILEPTGFINKLLLACGIISQPVQLAYNIWAVQLIMIYCYLPFMIMPIYTVLQKLNRQLLEASMDLGATSWQTFWRITVPLSWSGIKTGLLLVFVPAFGDFVIPSLIGGSRYLTVGSLISYYFLTAHNSGAGAAYTFLASVVLLVCIVKLERTTVTSLPYEE